MSSEQRAVSLSSEQFGQTTLDVFEKTMFHTNILTPISVKDGQTEIIFYFEFIVLNAKHIYKR